MTKHFLFFAPDGTEGGNENVNTDTANSDKTVPLSELIAERKKRQEASKELETIKQKLKEAEEAKLVEDGKIKEALEAKSKEFDDFKKSIEPKLKLADEYEEFQSKRRETIKDKLKDKWLDSFAKLPLADLEILSEKLALPNAVTTNNGTGAGTNSATLSAEEKQEAARMGLSEEGYVKFKETRAKLKGNK